MTAASDPQREPDALAELRARLARPKGFASLPLDWQVREARRVSRDVALHGTSGEQRFASDPVALRRRVGALVGDDADDDTRMAAAFAIGVGVGLFLRPELFDAVP